MEFFNRKTRLGAVIASAFLAVLAWSCDTGTNPSGESSGAEYARALACIDYDGANKAVFIDFSAENPIAAELPHDFFDLAVDSNGHIIANSGSYGSGVLAYKTDQTDITKDLSALADRVKEYTFREGKELYGYQEQANPFKGEISPLAQGSGRVYLIKTAAGNSYKMTFNMFGMGGFYRFEVVKGLKGTEKIELTGSLKGLINDPENTYGYIFFDLDADPPGALNASGIQLAEGAPPLPKSCNWDLLCTRTDEPQNGGAPAQLSSILLNIYREVTAYTAAGKPVRDVAGIAGLSPSTEIDAIGGLWHSADNSEPPVYRANENTYVVRTVEGNFAKFQPESYTGPAGEGFYMTFTYLYGNSSGTFAR
ncbi:MAG: hypothetical protein LBK63_05885 [Treponema sp.]|jgi:hypothetical protein|nr:hypothetical protein [Treponema sp.]